MFERVDYAATSPNGEPACIVSTCRHLSVGMYWDGTNHRYGQCRLGDIGARMAHLKNQIADRDMYVSWHADRDDLGLVPPPIMPPR